MSIRPRLAVLALGAATALTATLGLPTDAGAASGPPPADPDPSVHSGPGLTSESVEPARRAASGSLLFVRGYDVWISRTDGSDARRLTTDGTVEKPWLSPTQSDAGVIVASHDHRVVVMRPSGRVVASYDPPALRDSLDHEIDGTPSDVAISPDGSLVAYTFAAYSCPIVADCDTRFVTAYTETDRLTDPARYGTTYYDAPSWIGNHRTVQGGGQFAEVNVHDLGAAPQHWFRDSEINSPGRDLTDPTVSRDGQWVATIRGYGNTTMVVWWRVNGSITSGRPSLPTPWCWTNEEPIASPAFSADSSVLAWVLPGQGIWMTTDPGACNQPELVVRDASQPSFSAAPFSVPAPENVTRPVTSGTAKVGRSLTAGPGRWTPAPSSLGYRWLRDGRPIAGASGSRYRLTRKDARHRVSVEVTARGAGGSGTATSAPKSVRP